MADRNKAGEPPAEEALRSESGAPAESPAEKRRSAHCYMRATEGVVVEVEPMFLESQSFPELTHYVWAYRVTIRNERRDTVRLLSRYWRLTDSTGAMREVRGEGVVGETPLIRPGDRFVYTSSAPLPTPSGMMEGEYTMLDAAGDAFKAAIPAFSLDSPYERRVLN